MGLCSRLKVHLIQFPFTPKHMWTHATISVLMLCSGQNYLNDETFFFFNPITFRKSRQMVRISIPSVVKSKDITKYVTSPENVAR